MHHNKKAVQFFAAAVLTAGAAFMSIAHASEPATEAISEEMTEGTEENFAPAFPFATTTFDGEAVDEQIYEDTSLVMINFWEPWCGPCVGEMPELEELYQEYKEQGFLILGVYQTAELDEEIPGLLDDLGVTYPILHASEEFLPYMTQYVPTSFFIDGEGNLLSTAPHIGAMSKDEWEEIILSYMDMPEAE